MNEERRRALITGVNGQDGSYLAQFLVSKGYEVFGTTRVSVTQNLSNLSALRGNPLLTLIQADMQDSESLARAVKLARPHEVYNLAAVSYAPASWDCPSVTFDVNAGGVVRLLEAVRAIRPSARFYQASTSEMFGNTSESPSQNERTPFKPVHPYGAAKVAAHWAAVAYREQYNMLGQPARNGAPSMHVNCGILFNHESPRRGTQFVTRKVTQAALRHAGGLKDPLVLWTLDTVRDWGFSGDYVEAMWLMLQQEEPDDFVIGTGFGHSVKDLVATAYAALGLDWAKFVRVEPPKMFKVDTRSNFVADCAKAEAVLRWKPSTTFTQLIFKMLGSDAFSILGFDEANRLVPPEVLGQGE